MPRKVDVALDRSASVRDEDTSGLTNVGDCGRGQTEDVLEPLPAPRSLTVLVGGVSVGTVAITGLAPACLRGRFAPSVGFKRYRAVFQAAMALDQLFAAIHEYVCDRWLVNLYRAACDEIVRLKPVFVELPGQIDMFEIHSDWSVEISVDGFHDKQSLLSGK